MNNLFLDDDPERTKKFLSYAPEAITTATAQGMIELLGSTEDIGHVFLDHDLGGEIYVDASEANTGSEVVRWIRKNKPVVKTFIIHTMNTPAGDGMESDLRGMGYDVIRAPFVLLNWSAVQELE